MSRLLCLTELLRPRTTNPNLFWRSFSPLGQAFGPPRPGLNARAQLAYRHLRSVSRSHPRPASHHDALNQHSTTLSARPPRAVSLYLSFMSAPVSRIVLIALSSETWCSPSPLIAMRAAVIALTDAIALRSMHGI